MSGKFWIECHNTDGETYSTSDIDITTVDAATFKSVLETDCSFLKDKISVERLTGDFPDRNMGVEFQVFFQDVYGALDQYKLVAVPDYMDDPLIGVDIYTEESIVRPFGESLLYQVIPGEYLYTREDQSQVIVTVDDFPALCVSLECGYEYIESAGQLIDGFTIDGTQLSISGVGFETPVSVEIANVACNDIIVSETADLITCELAGQIPAGTWMPLVTLEKGKVNVDETVSPLVNDLVVSNVSPKLNLNPAGGDTITIDGSGFPESQDGRYDLSVYLGTSTRCVIFELSYTQIQCESEPFTTARRRMLQDSPFNLSLSFNSDGGLVEHIEEGLELNSDPITATGITPANISPIALRTIVVQLYADYPVSGMTKDDFTVTIVPESLELTYLTINNEGVRQLNVVAVDTTAKTITLKYGGAYSGTYDFVIKSATNGNVDTASFQLKVVFEITDFQP